MEPLNIILFGGTGAGKSSIVNMLDGNPNLAHTSSGAEGCTLHSTPYEIEHHGTTYRIHDTAGLEEGEAGRVPSSDAIVQLYRLLRNLGGNGVSLLIFCMRAPRIRDNAQRNWRLFHEVICKGRVPICIAITGLEQEINMDTWWEVNKGTFQRYEMEPSGTACICATRGRLNRDGRTCMFDDQFEESKEKMWRLIRERSLANPRKVDPVEWFVDVITTKIRFGDIWNLFHGRPWITTEHVQERVNGAGLQALIERCKFSPQEAKELGVLLCDGENQNVIGDCIFQ